jgi:hypothetical protein
VTSPTVFEWVAIIVGLATLWFLRASSHTLRTMEFWYADEQARKKRRDELEIQRAEDRRRQWLEKVDANRRHRARRRREEREARAREKERDRTTPGEVP